MSKLSKQERLARFKEKLNNITTWADVDKELSLQVTQFEKEFGILVTGDFPLMRFQRMYDDLVILNKREEKEMKRSQRKGRR